jgi:Rrf2 family protein
MLDSHFKTTLHLMTSLAYNQGDSLNSDTLAKSMGTNAAFVRKIMAKLAKAGLVESRRGKSGGVALARAAKEISLKQIYLAINENQDLNTSTKIVAWECPVSRSMCNIVDQLSRQMERAHLLLLSRIKLSHLVSEVRPGN